MLKSEKIQSLCDSQAMTGKQILVEPERLVRKHGKTVVVVTHTQEIGKMSDRVIKMRNGKITDVVINKNPVSAESIEW